MGHRKSIVRQAIEKLDSMAAFGQSKHLDKKENSGKPAVEKIYSFSTMKNYKEICVKYANWARSEHGCRTLEEAQQYTGAYLQQRMDAGASAWTIRRDAAGLAKLYQIKTTELGVELPTRHRGDVVQHRGGKTAGHFAPNKHKDLVDLCLATGLRRHEVAALRPEDVTQDAQGHILVHVRQGKGGKARTVQALNQCPLEIAQAAQAAGQDKVIQHIPKYAPIHEYRAKFARALYAQVARDPTKLARNERYDCRADMAGKSFDRMAMKVVSQALGHSRLDVVTAYFH